MKKFSASVNLLQISKIISFIYYSIKISSMKKITFLLLLTFTLFLNSSFSQNVDSTSTQKNDTIIPPTTEVKKFPKKDSIKTDFYVKGAVTVTNKGISYIPNFSLGKPAAIFDLSMSNKKLAFEPQLRFSLNGEPWSFLFPVRYKIKSRGKFQLSTGITPLLNFKNVTYMVNGVSTTDLVNRRYLGGEFKPTYFITKNISVSAYYLYFCGLSARTLQNTHFVSVITHFSNIKLGKQFFAKFIAQFYYLNQDGLDGFYFNPTLALLKRNFPFSIQTIVNTTIDTDIPGSQKFIWNVSLIYAFNKTYIRKIE